MAIVRCVAFLAVLNEAAHQRGGYRLPAHGLALFPQPYQALIRVEITGAQG
jgi:hypothetical protein